MTDTNAPRSVTEPAFGQSASTAGLGAWFPIETIPKDQTRVLVTDGVNVEFGFWGEGGRGHGRSYKFDFHVRGENLGCDGASDEFLGATFWMPIPEAPNVK